MENCIWIRVIGKGGMEKGTVIEEAVTFLELDRSRYPDKRILTVIQGMREELEGYENDYPEELKKRIRNNLKPHQ